MEENRIGVYICWCGTNISLMVDVENVAKEMAKLPNVIISRDYKYMCSDPGQDLIIKDIKEHKLNRIVVASCSPRMHEHTFRKTLAKAGLNPYYFEMANIREQNSWVHIDRAEATRKAHVLTAAAIKRVCHHEALDSRSVSIHPSSLIIGAGIAGISAALEIADSDRDVYLVERSDRPGGQTVNLDLTFPYFHSAQQMIASLLQRVMNHPHIKLFLNSEIKEVFGYIGNFETTIYGKDGKETKIQFGNTIVATGLKTVDASKIEQYGYGKLSNVITSLEFERMLMNGRIETKEGKEPKNIVIVHCVGSRNKKYHEYCSRVCCMTALKFANQIRCELPESNIFDLYADMRSFGKGCEELYALTSRKNIKFLMFDQENDLPRITKAGQNESCDMLVEMNELMTAKTIEIPADLVILMTGMEAHPDAKSIAHAVGVSICGNEFYIEKHPKLDPVATTTNGVYIVGACQSPKDIPETVSQAKAAAARILATIASGTVEVEVTTAVVNEDLCCGCRTCITVCPYTAISFNDEKNVSVVNDVLCKGCGTCGATCPTGAIRCRHFSDIQILSQIEGIMEMEFILEK